MSNYWFKKVLFVSLLVCGFSLQAATFSLSKENKQQLSATWTIDKDEYIITNKTGFSLVNNPNSAIKTQCPEGENYQDDFFGEIKIAKNTLECLLNLDKAYSGKVTVTSVVQICKLGGGCVAPISKTASTQAGDTSFKSPKKTSLFSNLLGGSSLSANVPLHVDKAFELLPVLIDEEGVTTSFNIADKHYLYKHAFKFNLLDNPNLKLGKALIPDGKKKVDKYFGDIEVYHNNVEILLPIQNNSDSAQKAQLEINYQGCAEKGICYPPTKRTVAINIPAKAQINPDLAISKPIKTNTDFNLNQQEDDLLGALKSGNILLVIGAFFIAGLLLSFTPCVFPMFPILSGIITGQGSEITTKKAFTLSLVYVLSMALVYTAIGYASGLVGESIQAWFQKPWVLLSFGAIIAFMALSMFGLFTIQMPQSIQSKASDISNQQKGGSLFGVAIMGMLSALIVGACSTPVLAVAIGYIGKSADPLLGAMGLFAMSIGMGLPLLLIGSSAGKLLPKQGMWMDVVKYVFGTLMITVALYIIDPVVPRPIMMTLWALLLIACGVYMGALAGGHLSGWQKLFKSLGLAVLAYGMIMLVGMATGKGTLLTPLKAFGAGSASTQQEHLQFTRIRGVNEFELKLAQAQKNQQYVMLDFYADWCKSCLELEEFTFNNPQVQQSLKNVMLLQADVTLNDKIDKELLKKFGINGPPAILFFDTKSQELRDFRLNGFFQPEDFSRHVKTVFN